MVMNSVNTNAGALVALQSLNRTNEALQTVQKRVTTGNRVNDAVDDGAAFAVAQTLRSEIGAYGAVNQQLGVAKGVVGVALEGATKVSDTLAKGREVLTKLADANLTAAQREQYNSDLSRLLGEVKNFIKSATFNETNLLCAGAATKKVISTISGELYDIAKATLNAATTALAAVATATDAANALTATGAWVKGNAATSNALNSLGGDMRRLTNQINFNSSLQKASEEALGTIVDADLAKESARLQSLQIRQQLGTQTLGIANQAPQILLGLFR